MQEQNTDRIENDPEQIENNPDLFKGGLDIAAVFEAAGFTIADDLTDAEVGKLAKVLDEVGGQPYAFYRMYRVGDKEELLGRFDYNDFDESEFAEQAQPGVYRRKLVVKGRRGIVFQKETTVGASAFSPQPGRASTPISGRVETVSELDQLRRENAQLRTTQSQPVQPRGGADWVSALPAIMTAATSAMALVTANRPDMSQIMAILQKQNSLGDVAESIRIVRDLAGESGAGGESEASMLGEIIAPLIPIVIAQIKANSDGGQAAPPEAKPEPTETATPDPRAGLLRDVVELIAAGASADEPEPYAYAIIIADRLASFAKTSGEGAQFAQVVIATIAHGEVGDLSKMLIEHAPTLEAVGAFVLEVEAELRKMLVEQDAPDERNEDAEEKDALRVGTDVDVRPSINAGSGGDDDQQRSSAHDEPVDAGIRQVGRSDSHDSG